MLPPSRLTILLSIYLRKISATRIIDASFFCSSVSVYFCTLSQSWYYRLTPSTITIILLELQNSKFELSDCTIDSPLSDSSLIGFLRLTPSSCWIQVQLAPVHGIRRLNRQVEDCSLSKIGIQKLFKRFLPLLKSEHAAVTVGTFVKAKNLCLIMSASDTMIHYVEKIVSTRARLMRQTQILLPKTDGSRKENPLKMLLIKRKRSLSFFSNETTNWRHSSRETITSFMVTPIAFEEQLCICSFVLNPILTSFESHRM